MFIKSLEEVFRNPLHKNYQQYVETRASIKGKPLLQDSLKKQDLFFGKVICEYDVFSRDNIFNQIIKYTVYTLLLISSEDYFDVLYKYYSQLSKVSLISLKDQDFFNIRYNRFNEVYKPIHDFCHMLINNFSISFNTGSYSSYCFLFNTNIVYESFLRNLIKEMLIKKGFKTYKYSKGEKIEPDIIIERENKILLVCDAKYKFTYDINDFREMLDYLSFFAEKNRKNKQNIKIWDKYVDENFLNGILIYPQINSSENLVLKDHREGKNIFTYFIDLSKIRDKQYLITWFNEIDLFLSERNTEYIANRFNIR